MNKSSYQDQFMFRHVLSVEKALDGLSVVPAHPTYYSSISPMVALVHVAETSETSSEAALFRTTTKMAQFRILKKGVNLGLFVYHFMADKFYHIFYCSTHNTC